METLSLCPICHSEIPATIFIDDNVWMRKTCPDHGNFRFMVERDPEWFNLCQKLNCKNIYNGLFIDVTNKCNIKCAYCFHDNNSGHIDKEDIINHAKENKGLTPFVLTGGEPTLHPDLPGILKSVSDIGETVLLTNGIKLCDESYFDEICESGIKYGKILSIGLSFHKESNGKDFEFLDLCRKKGLKAGTTLIVIDQIEQVSEALDIYRDYRDVIGNIRIKAATNIWDEQGSNNKIFTSDIINYIKGLGEVELDISRFNKVSFANLIFDGMSIMPVSWYDTNNVDLNDINCAPWYKSNDGKLYNLVTACLKNEGIK